MDKIELIRKSIESDSYATGPLSIRVGLSEECNFNCITCWNHSSYLKPKRSSNSVRMSYQEISSVLKEAKDLGVVSVLFSGTGEPFMHPDAEKIIESAFRLGFNIRLQTNLSLVKCVSRIAKFFKREYSLICVNIMAAKAITYNRVHPNQPKDSFLKLINKVKTLVRNGSKVRYVFIVNKYNYDEVEKAIELSQKLKTRLHLELMDFQNREIGKLSINNFQKERLKVILKKYKGVDGMNVNEFLNQLKYGGIGYNKIDKCYLGYFYVAIKENGDLYYCYAGNKRFLMGNVLTNSLKDIWFSRKYCNFRLRLKEGRFLKECVSCKRRGSNFKIRSLINEFIDNSRI